MIRNINSKLLKNQKLKLCAIGTIGFIVAASLTGCATHDLTLKEQNKDDAQSIELLLDNENQATINLDYQGTETLTERDIITFSNPETAEIFGIASTDKEQKQLTLPAGEYMVTSNYLEREYFEVKNQEEWNIEANYHTNTIHISQKENTKSSVR